MKNKIKSILVIALMFGLIANANPALAYTGETAGGTLGKTTVTYVITVVGSNSTYDQAYLSIGTEHVVDELGIKNINVIRGDGGGVTGVSRSETNSKGTVVYRGSAYAPNSIRSVSANFYVNSGNFGNFSKNMAISS